MSFIKKKSLGSFQSDPSGEYIDVLSAKTTKAQLGQMKGRKKKKRLSWLFPGLLSRIT